MCFNLVISYTKILVLDQSIHLCKCAVLFGVLVLFLLLFTDYVTRQVFKLTDSEDLIQDNSIRPPVD